MGLDFLRSSLITTTSFKAEEVAVQALLLLVYTIILGVVYYYLGSSVSNRTRVAGMFPMMALTTMLVIAIIKSSLALSLGLVGALSIVRFRAAIKDPEELVYIFLAISLGLGFGSNQVGLTSVFYAMILVVIVVQGMLRKKWGRVFADRDSLRLEIEFAGKKEITAVVKILDKHCTDIKLVRVSDGEKQLMMFLIKVKADEQMEALRQELHRMDSKATVNFLQYQQLV